jgi:iron complex outermembrane receptor protein
MTNPRQAAAAAVAGDQARNTYVQRFANVTSIKLDFGRLDITSWAIHKHLNHPIFQVLDQDGWTYGISPRFTGSFNLAGYRNDLIVGARIFAGNNQALQFVNAGNAVRGAQTVNARQIASNYEAWFENRFFVLPQVALTAGLKAYRVAARLLRHAQHEHGARRRGHRRDLFRRQSPRRRPLGAGQGRAGLRQRDALGRRAGLLRPDADDGDHHRLRAAEGADRHDLRDRHARPLWPRLRGRPPPGVPTCATRCCSSTSGAAFPRRPSTLPRTQLQGVELAASVDLSRNLTGRDDRLTLKQVWTWSDFRFVGDATYGNNRLPLVPVHVLRTSLTYAHPAGFSITPSVDIVPQGAFVDYANTFRVPGYALFNVGASARLPNGGEAFVDVRNIADKRYYRRLRPCRALQRGDDVELLSRHGTQHLRWRPRQVLML